jgi:hypothetical protein
LGTWFELEYLYIDFFDGEKGEHRSFVENKSAKPLFSSFSAPEKITEWNS